MQRKLRVRFILTTMLSVLLVLGALMTVLNTLNYRRVATNSDRILDVLAQNGGKFDLPEPPPPDGQIPTALSIYKPWEAFGAETPYDTRYFSVKFIQDDTIVRLDAISAISSSQAVEMAKKVKNSANIRGYEGIYRYLVAEDGALVIFIDCTRQLQLADTFLYLSLIVSASGLLVVGMLVTLLSKRIIKPITDSYERQKMFITDAGHELKTPLSIISTHNELNTLENGETESSVAIAKQVARMTAMVKNLTALARMDETGKITRTKVSVSALAEECVSLFLPTLKRNHRSFTQQIEQNLTYEGDEVLLKQLLAILLDNAAKYALTHASLTLSRLGKKLVLLVSNDAEGVRTGKLARCFERFYRADVARASNVEGSGIGLSLAKEIVIKHGGEITAYCERDAIFCIKIIL